MFFAAVSLYAQDYRLDESGKFYQILRWGSGGTDVLFYGVEVEQRDENGEFLPVFTGRSESLEIEVSLPPGRYHYRIISYNVLGKPAAWSDWYAFRVLPALTPKARAPELIEAVRGEPAFTVVLEGADLIEGAEVSLVGKGKKPAAFSPLSVNFAEDDSAITAVFGAEGVAAGKYDITIVNPGGLSQTLENVPLKIVRPQKAASWPPLFTFGIGGEANANSFEKFAAAGVLYGGWNISDRFTLGLKANAGWDFTEEISAEGAAFFRWYPFTSGGRFSLFAQAGGGAGFYRYYDETKTEDQILILGEGMLGVRIRLGRRFFIEPYVRGAHPSLWGAGIAIGG